VLNYYLKKKANSNIYNKDMCTPMHLAIKKKSTTCVAILMKYKANWKYTDSEGNDAKGLATKIGCLEIKAKIESIEENIQQKKRKKLMQRTAKAAGASSNTKLPENPSSNTKLPETNEKKN